MKLKPKRELTYVPGHGVVNKSEFNEEHLKACIDHVKSCDLDVDAYLKSRFESVVEESAKAEDEEVKPEPKAKGKKKVESKVEKTEDEILEEMIKEEENAKEE